MARHLAKLIKDSRPNSIAIENVRGYAQSQSLAIIVSTLLELGYEVRQSIECAANYGSPTTRERLIVRASMAPMRDLIHPVMSRSKPCFTLLAGGGNPKILIDGAGNNYGADFTIRTEKHPAYTISAEDGKGATARSKILIERVGYYGGSPSIYDDSIPAPTIRSAPHCDDKGTYRVAANIIDDYECYAADIKCLAAWQGFPADYQWGNNRAQAGRGIGNAVPCQLARSVAQSLNP